MITLSTELGQPCWGRDPSRATEEEGLAPPGEDIPPTIPGANTPWATLPMETMPCCGGQTFDGQKRMLRFRTNKRMLLLHTCPRTRIHVQVYRDMNRHRQAHTDWRQDKTYHTQLVVKTLPVWSSVPDAWKTAHTHFYLCGKGKEYIHVPLKPTPLEQQKWIVVSPTTTAVYLWSTTTRYFHKNNQEVIGSQYVYKLHVHAIM